MPDLRRGGEEELQRALDQCEQNPVKHGLVSDATLWPYSSFAKGRMGDLAQAAPWAQMQRISA